MKILFIFSLSLISGPVGCAVTGYSGGSIIVISDQKWNLKYNRYICKKEETSCTDIICSRTSVDSVQVGRFLIYKNIEGFLSVLIRSLKPQDAGMYRMGVGTWMTTDVNLKVVSDSCCAEPKTVSAFPGQNINIISNYPKKYEKHHKFIMKVDNHSVLKVVLESRLSASEDKSAKVFSVNISNVRKDDDGIYLCGVYDKLNSVQYLSFFSEIQLHVKAKTEIPPDSKHFNSSSTITISVSVCFTLLLIGGLALLIYKLRHKRTDASTPSSKDNEQVSPTACVYEDINQTKHASASNNDLYMNASSPSNSTDRKIFPTVQPAPDQHLTYTTLIFPNNTVAAAVTFSKEESMTEYATVQHTSRP